MIGNDSCTYKQCYILTLKCLNVHCNIHNAYKNRYKCTTYHYLKRNIDNVNLLCVFKYFTPINPIKVFIKFAMFCHY